MKASRAILVLTALSLAALFAAPSLWAQATQSRVSIGAQAGYVLDDVKEPLVGAHLLVVLPAGFALYPAFQGYFPQAGSLWRVSSAVRWAHQATGVAPYAALGPYWMRRDKAGVPVTSLGVIGLVGVEGRLTKVRPFAEFQLLTNGPFTAELSFGVRAEIGR